METSGAREKKERTSSDVHFMAANTEIVNIEDIYKLPKIGACTNINIFIYQRTKELNLNN